MAIHNQPIQEGDSGWKKTFEAGSEVMLLDFVQSAQYSTPIPSAVREITSNAIDSTREKQRFFLISKGEAKVEDFYIQREGDLYKDSNYDPNYYDEKWLSKTEDTIKLIYKEGNASQRDTLHIIDTGVGMGGTRLEKHFNPLFSTKRNNNQDLGKFGIGSKAGLSLDVDYYTVISRYNGAEFHFNVYSYKVDPIVPKFDLVKGVENPFYTTQVIKDKNDQPIKFHYYPTTEPNGVEVVLQAKKGLKKEFIDAVKGQLLYLDGIEFELEENGVTIPQVVKAEIEYESELFVLPTAKSTYYSKPHVILNGICYGYINFLQMEEEDKVGNIGIKMDPSKIDINPNRESVRYTQKTIQAFKDYMEEGKHEAEKVLTQSLQTTDLIDWVLKSAGALVGINQTSVVGRFSNISDIKAIKPKFLPMPKIRFNRDPDEFFKSYDLVQVNKAVRHSKAKGTYINSLDRTKVTSWNQFGGKQIYYQDGDTTFRQDMFMLTIYPNGFIKVLRKGEFSNAGKITEEQAEAMEIKFEDWLKLTSEEKDKMYDMRKQFYVEQSAAMDDLIKESSKVLLYSSVNVPEDFRTNEKEQAEDEEEAVEAAMKEMSPAEQRKLQERMVVTAFDYKSYLQAEWQRNKREPRIKEILTQTEELIYGFGEDEANLCLAAEILGFRKQYHSTWNDNSITVAMVSQSNAKYLKPHIYIDDFFSSFNPQTNTISMHNKLVKWQTARKINEILPKLNFLTNFKLFDAQASTLYSELKSYRDANFMDLTAAMHDHKQNGSATEVIEGLKTFADKLTEFQLFVAKHPGNIQGIAAMSKALFETNEDNSFEDALGIEMEVYEKLLLLIEHTQPVQILLNKVTSLVSTSTIDYALEQEIKEYLEYKGYISLTNPTSSVPTSPVQNDEIMETSNSTF